MSEQDQNETPIPIVKNGIVVDGVVVAVGLDGVAGIVNELVELRATLARVEQLAAHWESPSIAVSGDDGHEGTAALAVARAFATELRAALVEAKAKAN